jgi:hypothetical protein
MSNISEAGFNFILSVKDKLRDSPLGSLTKDTPFTKEMLYPTLEYMWRNKQIDTYTMTLIRAEMGVSVKEAITDMCSMTRYIGEEKDKYENDEYDYMTSYYDGSDYHITPCDDENQRKTKLLGSGYDESLYIAVKDYDDVEDLYDELNRVFTERTADKALAILHRIESEGSA